MAKIHRKWKSESDVFQSCLTLCDPMDCSLPGFSVHGIFQASVLEWVAISFSRGSSWPGDLPDPGIEPRSPALQADALPSEPPGKPTEKLYKKDLHDPDNHNGVIPHLEPDILECEIKWALESITTNKAKGQFSFQSQRKAIPKNAQTAAQLHSFYTLVK